MVAYLNVVFHHDWVDMTVFAIAIGGTISVAGWAGFSPRRSIPRPAVGLLLWVWISLIIPFAYYVAEITSTLPLRDSFSPTENTLSLVAIFPAGIVGYFIIRVLALWFRWRLVQTNQDADFPSWRTRFSVRHLLATTTLLAITMAAARIIVPVASKISFGFLWQIILVVGLSFCIPSLMITIPTWWLSAIAIKRRLLTLFLWVSYCLATSFVFVVILTLMLDGGTSNSMAEPTLAIGTMLLGQSAVVWLNIQFLKRMGYRLQRLPARKKDSEPKGLATDEGAPK